VTGRLVHTGQVVIDLVMRVPHLPPPGGDVLASATDTLPGGGFNVMQAAARAGAAVVYAGGHGRGRFGDIVRAALAAEGVRVALPPSAADTGICVVMVDDSAERTFVTSADIEPAVDPAAFAAVPITAADLVYVSGYSLLTEGKAAVVLDRLDRDHGLSVLADPGPLGAQAPAWDRLLAHMRILSCNAREARLMTDTEDLVAASAALAGRLAPGAAVVVRDGAAGCLLTHDGHTDAVPGFPAEVVDTTGAGDTHCGTLAAELLRGADLRTAALRANAAAAIAVTRRGPATSPTRAEVDTLLTAHPA
jgi:sugar/nucleoside kinase (ribokinase family)